MLQSKLDQVLGAIEDGGIRSPSKIKFSEKIEVQRVDSKERERSGSKGSEASKRLDSNERSEFEKFKEKKDAVEV